MSEKLGKSGHLKKILGVLIIGLLLAYSSGLLKSGRKHKGLSELKDQIIGENTEKFEELWNKYSDDIKGEVSKLLSNNKWKGLVANFISQNRTTETITAFISTENGLKICPPNKEGILCILTEQALNSFLPPKAKVADVEDLEIERIDESKYEILMKVGVTGVSQCAVCQGIVDTETMELEKKSVSYVEN